MRHNSKVIIGILSFILCISAGCTKAISEETATSQYDLPTEIILKETEAGTETMDEAPWQASIDPTQYTQRLLPLVQEAVEKANQDNLLLLDSTTLNSEAFTAQGMYIEVLNRSENSDLQYDSCYQLELIYKDEQFVCDSIEKREILPENTGVADGQDRQQMLSQINELFEKYTLYEEYLSGKGFSTTFTTVEGTTDKALLVVDGPIRSLEEYTAFLQNVFSQRMAEEILQRKYFLSDAAGNFYLAPLGMTYIGCDFDMVYDIASEDNAVSVAYLQPGGHSVLETGYTGTYVMNLVYENGALKIDEIITDAILHAAAIDK